MFKIALKVQILYGITYFYLISFKLGLARVMDKVRISPYLIFALIVIGVTIFVASGMGDASERDYYYKAERYCDHRLSDKSRKKCYIRLEYAHKNCFARTHKPNSDPERKLYFACLKLP